MQKLSQVSFCEDWGLGRLANGDLRLIRVLSSLARPLVVLFTDSSGKKSFCSMMCLIEFLILPVRSVSSEGHKP